VTAVTPIVTSDLSAQPGRFSPADSALNWSGGWTWTHFTCTLCTQLFPISTSLTASVAWAVAPGATVISAGTGAKRRLAGAPITLPPGELTNATPG